NTTRVTRGEQGGMINRRGQGFVGKQGDNVYAGRDGNAYRRDASGNWSKFDNGQWNPVQKPDGAPSTRDKMLNDQARQRDRSAARGERTGESLARPGQLDR